MKKKIKTRNNSNEDVRSLMLHLESEYRKANISEGHYKELKEKYQKMLKDHGKEYHRIENEKKIEIHKKELRKEVEPEEEEEVEEENEEVKPEEAEEHLKKVEQVAEKEMAEAPKGGKKGFLKSIFGKNKEEAPKEETLTEEKTVEMKSSEQPKTDTSKKGKKEEKEEEIIEITPEVIERLAQQVKEQSESPQEENKEEGKEKKGGFLKGLFGKKKEVNEASAETKTEIAQTETASEIVSEPVRESRASTNNYDVEIEKIKVMLDIVKETGRVTDETIRNVSESVGEIRSMVFQADAELKENAIKMEKLEDEISEVKPQEISKKIREFDEIFEKHQLQLEMIEKKTSDAGEKTNKILEMLRSIGGIENLVNINSQIQKKLNDINEAMKYIERIGTKTEKMFIDLNKGLQDLVLIKAKQDDFNESLKDMIKNMDALNVKFEGYVTKKDLDVFREDNILIKKQIDDIKKVLPIVELKLPESIINLRKEREDIRMLVESLEDQMMRGKITSIEFDAMKKANMEKLEDIRIELEKEWKKVGELAPPKEGEQAVEPSGKIEEKVEATAETPKEEKAVSEGKPEKKGNDGKKENEEDEETEETGEEEGKEAPKGEKKGFLKTIFGKNTEEAPKEGEPKEEKTVEEANEEVSEEEPEETEEVEEEPEAEEVKEEKTEKHKVSKKEPVEKKPVYKKPVKKKIIKPKKVAKPTKPKQPKKKIVKTESKRKADILSSLKSLS
jgi:hypothetical protein